MAAHEIGPEMYTVESDIDIVGSDLETDIDIVYSDLELTVDHSYYKNAGQNVQRAACNLWELNLRVRSCFELVVENTGSLLYVTYDAEVHRLFLMALPKPLVKKMMDTEPQWTDLAKKLYLSVLLMPKMPQTLDLKAHMSDSELVYVLVVLFAGLENNHELQAALRMMRGGSDYGCYCEKIDLMMRLL